MNLLAIDTSSKDCSVALFKSGKLISEITEINNDTHSRHLLSIIERLLKSTQTDIQDIDIFAAVKGPGSFTGLRIGLSTIKGLAFTGDKKFAGISSLSALAFGCPSSKLIAPIIDARKKELYFALYKFENGNLIEIEKEQVLSVEAMCKKITAPCLFVGTGLIYKDLIKEKLKENAFFAEEKFNVIRAESVGKLALEKIEKGKLKSADEITPLYIRKSEAELNFKEKKKDGRKLL